MSTQILWYDEQERPKGVLAYDSAVHEEDLDGADKLTVVTRRNAAKRDRLVWQDNAGYWHEHIVDEISTTHKGGAKRHTLTCSNSISELFRIEAPGTKAKKRVSEHLADICSGTRWNAGNSSGMVVEVETWHKSVRECMTELCNQCNGNLVTHIDVDDNGIVSRTVRVVVDYGTNTVKRTFTYGHNMGAVKREVAADEVYTAVRGYGAKTAETAWQAHIDDLQDQYDASTDSAVRRKLQKRINAAREKLKAVQDNDYAERLKVEVKKNSKKRNRWGVFNGLTMQHSWYIYTDDNCTSRQFLRRQCNALLKSLCNPLVRYEFDTAEVDSEMWHDVRLGSKVLCVDPVFEGGAAIERVSHIRRNLSGTMQCRIAIGKRANPQIDQYKTTQRLSKITTGNGVKTQSYTPTSSGGNYSGVGGYSPIGQYEVDGEVFTIGDGNQPAAIQVITPPTKTGYYVNDDIDYSGIEVQLLDGEGEVYTSDAYPDGMIPFDELEFPVLKAELNQDGGGYMFDIDLPMSDFDQYFDKPLSVAKVITSVLKGVSEQSRHGDIYCTYEIDDGYLIPINNKNDNEKLSHLYAVSTNPNAIVTTTRVGIGEGMDIYNFVRTSWLARNSEPTLISRTTFYSNIVISWNENPNSEISVPLNYTKERITRYYEDFVCQIGTVIFDGYKAGGKTMIPVEWEDFLDEFEIEVSVSPIEYNTTAYKSTGGGRF